MRIRLAEREFAARLRSVARRIQEIVRGFLHPDEEPESEIVDDIAAQLNRYAETIRPWASAVSARMLADVERRDVLAWRKLSQRIGRVMWREINTAPTGHVMRESLARQVDLITSLPREAAVRVQHLALEGLATGRRAGEIRYPARPPEGLAQDILDTGHVTVSRANTIARTETSRAATEIMQARAKAVGSEAYIWRTARDRDVRPSHRKMEGKIVRWDQPPELDKMVGHAGTLPNCRQRCWCEPIIPPPLYP